MEDELTPRTSLLVQITRLTEQLSALSSDIRELRHDFRQYKEDSKADVTRLRDEISETLKDYVTKDAFDPVKLLAYGAASVLLTTMLGGFALLALKLPTL
ncbi:hypothetical protein [Inquilinus limosus]|uniref:Uncharacterized protein n=1 Tax=Inquilinus limosus MP06 TaxID=1398085 RepID=A0A0A0DDZ1_9PROT|nr:hypothetical protein [Inquilinus limosus]KGM36118.1 hypothetical protein P409_00275 [Inquilinus limosus MP06]